MRDRIGEMLLKAGIISNADLERAQEYQRQHGGRISHALIHLDILSEDDLLEFFSREYGLPTVSLDEIDFDPRAFEADSSSDCPQVPSYPVSAARFDAAGRYVGPY